MSILVYGFGPYKQFRDNITSKIIDALPFEPGLKKAVFPVRFYRRQFIDALEKYRPDTVIGLGQCTRTTIEIETRALNERRARKSDPVKPIRRNGPKALSTTLDVKVARGAATSNNAGDYVCNYSMYVMLDYINRKSLPTRLGFIHIPYDCDLRKGVRLVARAIDKLKAREDR